MIVACRPGNSIRLPERPFGPASIDRRSTSESVSSSTVGPRTVRTSSGTRRAIGRRMPERTGVRHRRSYRPGAVSRISRYAGRASWAPATDAVRAARERMRRGTLGPSPAHARQGVAQRGVGYLEEPFVGPIHLEDEERSRPNRQIATRSARRRSHADGSRARAQKDDLQPEDTTTATPWRPSSRPCSARQRPRWPSSRRLAAFPGRGWEPSSARAVNAVEDARARDRRPFRGRCLMRQPEGSIATSRPTGGARPLPSSRGHSAPGHGRETDPGRHLRERYTVCRRRSSRRDGQTRDEGGHRCDQPDSEPTRSLDSVVRCLVGQKAARAIPGPRSRDASEDDPTGGYRVHGPLRRCPRRLRQSRRRRAAPARTLRASPCTPCPTPRPSAPRATRSSRRAPPLRTSRRAQESVCPRTRRAIRSPIRSGPSRHRASARRGLGERRDRSPSRSGRECGRRDTPGT